MYSISPALGQAWRAVVILMTDEAAHIRKVLRVQLERVRKEMAESEDVFLKKEEDDILKALSFL